MPIVKRDSRSRIGIEWYDNEAEANERAAKLTEAYSEGSIADANIGFAQCGRDRGFDTEVDGKPAFAVVTP